MVIEERRDGTVAIRFGKHYLEYKEIVATQRSGVGNGASKKTSDKRAQPTSRPYQPPANHPWRKRVV